MFLSKAAFLRALGDHGSRVDTKISTISGTVHSSSATEEVSGIRWGEINLVETIAKGLEI